MKNETSLEYVGFWPRVGAALIDVLLQIIVTIPLTYAVYNRISAPPGRFFMGFADVVINYVLPAAVVIAFWIYKGATPGKMAMSARIVDADTGAPLKTSAAVIRYIGYFVSLLPLGVGYLWVAFDRRKQGWHDKMANSVVVWPSGKEPVRFSNGVSRSVSRSEPTY